MGTRRETEIRERGTITFTPINLKDMELSIKNKEFKTVTDLVNFAIRYYFDNRNRDRDREMDQSEAIQKYFDSKDGEEKMTELMMKAMERKLRGK
ncbi:hypothetical protein [Methanoregula sp.]|uniref:hypothetical protein n=1 Tax=Methanoregula sp. TaxID=2052170 RepID=UPI003562A5D2